MDRGSGTFPVKEMGRHGVGNLPIGPMSFRAVTIPGRVIMFVVIAIRKHLLTITRIEGEGRLTWYECNPIPIAPPTRMILTLKVPKVSNLLYPQGKVSLGDFRDIRHVASVTKSYSSAKVTRNTKPTRSQKVRQGMPSFSKKRS